MLALCAAGLRQLVPEQPPTRLLDLDSDSRGNLLPSCASAKTDPHPHQGATGIGLDRTLRSSVGFPTPSLGPARRAGLSDMGEIRPRNEESGPARRRWHLGVGGVSFSLCLRRFSILFLAPSPRGSRGRVRSVISLRISEVLGHSWPGSGG